MTAAFEAAFGRDFGNGELPVSIPARMGAETIGERNVRVRRREIATSTATLRADSRTVGADIKRLRLRD